MAIPALSGGDVFLRTVERTSIARVYGAENSVSLKPSLITGSLAPSGASRPVVLGLGASREVVEKAFEGARQVLDKLQALHATANESLEKAGYLNFAPDISRASLQSEAERIIRQLDDAVAGASVSGANLISGQSGAYRLATTGLGGSIDAAVQGLDSRTLGLTGLDLTTARGIEDAITRVSAALNDAGLKFQRLSSLSRAFGSQQEFVNALDDALSSRAISLRAGAQGYGASGAASGNGANSRGTYVNLLA